MVMATKKQTQIGPRVDWIFPSNLRLDSYLLARSSPLWETETTRCPSLVDGCMAVVFWTLLLRWLLKLIRRPFPLERWHKVLTTECGWGTLFPLSFLGMQQYFLLWDSLGEVVLTQDDHQHVSRHVATGWFSSKSYLGPIHRIHPFWAMEEAMEKLGPS